MRFSALNDKIIRSDRQNKNDKDKIISMGIKTNDRVDVLEAKIDKQLDDLNEIKNSLYKILNNKN